MRVSKLAFSLLLPLLAQGACSPTENRVNIARESVWELVHQEDKTSLRGLDAVSAQVVWASGTQGTVLRTLDGGKTWMKLPVPGAEALDFRDVEAFGPDKAFLMSAGQPARIYSTEDGGTTWTIQYEDPTGKAFFDSMAFWDEENGIVFSDPVDGHFFVIRTVDGRNWSPLETGSLPPPMEGEAGFAASGTILVTAAESMAWIATGGSASRVFFTPDRGTSWVEAPSTLNSGTASKGVFSLAFRDPLHGVAVGGDYQSPEDRERIAARTTDGGKTWQTAVEMPGGYRSGAAGSPGSDLFIAVGPTGTDISKDGGETWQALDPTGFHVVAFSQDGTAWAAGSDGRIGRLTLESQ